MYKQLYTLIKHPKNRVIINLRFDALNEQIKRSFSSIMREDWVECKIGDVFAFLGGGTPSKNDASYWNGDVNWASIKDIKGQYLHKTEDRITKLGVDNSSTNIAQIDEIILATRINPGRPILSKIVTAINQDLKIVRFPKDVINLKFAYFLFKNLEKDVLKLSSGTTVLGINLNNLNSIQFPLPPLPEQRAIVKKIEALFSSLDTGISDLKKAQEQLKIYRQAVLKKAFVGDWQLVKLGMIFDFIGGGTPSKKEDGYWNGDIPWASIKDIKGDYLNTTQDFITQKGLENSASNIAKSGDVILATRINPGRSIITNIDTAINQDLKVVKTKYYYNSKFIHYLFKSIEDKCLKVSSGTTVLGITLPNLKDIEIPKIENTDEQAQIVKEIESRLSVCDAVEQQIKDSLSQAEALRQSILKKAFEGRLLSEAEVTACQQEPDYEPAAVLLEKIKAEKVASRASATSRASKGTKRK